MWQRSPGKESACSCFGGKKKQLVIGLCVPQGGGGGQGNKTQVSRNKMKIKCRHGPQANFHVLIVLRLTLCARSRLVRLLRRRPAMRWCRAKTDFPTAVSARSWMQKGVFYAVTNQSERLSVCEWEARLHGLTSLRALRGQGRSGRQLCVQALDLGVLGEQKLLKAADLCLWGEWGGGHTVRSLGISDMRLCKYILRVPERVCTGAAQSNFGRTETRHTFFF